MTVIEEALSGGGRMRINFPKSVRAWKFDDPDTHGRRNMRRVDIIAELGKEFLFIEIKSKLPLKGGHVVEKFRDSLLYELAEGRADKPIRYFVLVGSDEPAVNLSHSTRRLQDRLPQIGPFGREWKQHPRLLVASCAVMDIRAWNRWLPSYPAVRVSRGGSP